MNVVVELFVVTCKILWCFVLVCARWVLKPREKAVVGQVCLVTGAGSGLGRLFAEEFALRGATLVLWDTDRFRVAQTADNVRKIHQDFVSSRETGVSLNTEGEGIQTQPQVHTFICDVSKRDQVYEVAKKVQQEVGDVEFLINSAGTVSGWHLLECPDQLIEHTMMVNCHALFWTSKAFLPRMLELNHGHIVTVASTLGVFSAAGVEDYCASKSGAVGFHESLSHELKAMNKEGVKMTLVCPSVVDADMFSGCQIRNEIAPLFPPVSPEQSVRQAMRAILTDQTIVCTPRSMYLFSFLKTILPFDAVVCIYRFLGADKCLHPFLAHRREMMNNNPSRLGD